LRWFLVTARAIAQHAGVVAGRTILPAQTSVHATLNAKMMTTPSVFLCEMTVQKMTIELKLFGPENMISMH